MTAIWNRNEPTSARTHDKPGRTFRPKSLTFDIHSHVGIPAAAALAVPHLDPATIPLVRWQSPETRAVNDKQEGDLKTRITGMDAASPVAPQAAITTSTGLARNRNPATTTAMPSSGHRLTAVCMGLPLN